METQVEVKNEGGRVTVQGESVKVENANAVTLYISSATNFVSYKDVSGDAHKRATTYLNAARKKYMDKPKKSISLSIGNNSIG